MPRLFAAIRPPASVRDALIDTMEGVSSARWQDEDQLHLTLRFIGDVDNHTSRDVSDALGSVTSPPFPLALRGVGTFQRKGRVHTAWAGVVESPALLALQKKVERACQATGLEPEHRKFAPHVTIARMKGAGSELGDWLSQHQDFESETWMVEDFRLYESELSPGGSLYSALARYPLGG